MSFKAKDLTYGACMPLIVLLFFVVFFFVFGAHSSRPWSRRPSS